MHDKKKIITILSILGFLFLGSLSYNLYVNYASNSSYAGKQVNISSISPEEFKRKLDSGEYILIDVRTKQEYNSGHIKGALNSDFYNQKEFLDFLSSLDKNKKYLIYCRSGNRSEQTLDIMRNLGFKEVYDLSGGIKSWVAQGF